MLTWEQYRANHPEVLASWGQQNGRPARCWCPRCRPFMDTPDPASPEAALVFAGAAVRGGKRTAMYEAAIASALGEGRGVALHTVLTQMRAEPFPGLQKLAADVERTLADALITAARDSPEIMAQVVDLVRRAHTSPQAAPDDQ